MAGQGPSTYDKVAGQDLHDLCPHTCPALEDPLQDVDHEMGHRSADDSAVERHFRNARREVTAILVLIVGNPGRQKFLQAG